MSYLWFCLLFLFAVRRCDIAQRSPKCIPMNDLAAAEFFCVSSALNHSVQTPHADCGPPSETSMVVNLFQPHSHTHNSTLEFPPPTSQPTATNSPQLAPCQFTQLRASFRRFGPLRVQALPLRRGAGQAHAAVVCPGFRPDQPQLVDLHLSAAVSCLSSFSSFTDSLCFVFLLVSLCSSISPF